MRLSSLFILSCLIIATPVLSQGIGIGTTTPHSSAQLEISSNNKGVLIPRLTTTQRIAINGVTGLLVYDITDSAFYYHDGVVWRIMINNGNGTAWFTNGNAHIDPATQFIGTRDNSNVVIKRNNSRAGLLDTTNTSFGVSALSFNTTGQYNTAIGVNALYSNTAGTSNTAIGLGSLGANTAGIRNVAVGVLALTSNTTGSDNTAIGTNTMTSNTTGFGNTAIGEQTMFSNTTGSANTSAGYNALYTNSTGQLNTASGFYALVSNTTGSNNTAMGADALNANTTGYNNTGTGAEALYSNTTGMFNTATGNASLRNNTTGILNTANGLYSLLANTTGIANTAIGSSALGNNTTGQRNTGIGSDVMVTVTTGQRNTALGYGAGAALATGNDNTAIGYNANFGAANIMNATAIGANAIVNRSNAIVLGNNADVGIGTSNPLAKLDVAGTIRTEGFRMPTNAQDGAVLTSNEFGDGVWKKNENVLFSASSFQYDFEVPPTETREMRDWQFISNYTNNVIFNNGTGELHLLVKGIYRVTVRVVAKFDNPDANKTHSVIVKMTTNATGPFGYHQSFDPIFHTGNTGSSFNYCSATIDVMLPMFYTTFDYKIQVLYKNNSATTSAVFSGVGKSYCEFTVEKLD